MAQPIFLSSSTTLKGFSFWNLSIDLYSFKEILLRLSKEIFLSWFNNSIWNSKVSVIIGILLPPSTNQGFFKKSKKEIDFKVFSVKSLFLAIRMSLKKSWELKLIISSSNSSKNFLKILKELE